MHDAERRYDLVAQRAPVFLGSLYPENNHTPHNATDPSRMSCGAVEVKRHANELSAPGMGALLRPIPALRAALAAKRQDRFREFHTELNRRTQGQGLAPDDALFADTILKCWQRQHGAPLCDASSRGEAGVN